MNMKNRKKAGVIIGVVAVIVISAAWYIYEKGNPFDAGKLNRQTEMYLQESYPDLYNDFERTTDAYFAKRDTGYYDSETQAYIPMDGSWQVYYTKKDEPETHIYFIYDRSGKMVYDSCADRYLKGGHIYERLSREYNNYIVDLYHHMYENTVQHTDYENNMLGSSGGQAWFKDDAYSPVPWNTMYVPARILHYKGPELDLNRQYTMEELAAEYGVIHFRYNDGISIMAKHNQQQSKEDYLADYKAAIDNLYKRCLEIRDAIKEHNVPFKEICVTHGLYEGIYYMSREQLFSDDLYQYIYDNHAVL